MNTVSSASYPAFTEKLLAAISKDVSVHRDWYLESSGLDALSWHLGEFFGNGSELTENAINVPEGHLIYASLPKTVSVFIPRTELARRLWEIRKRIVASGEELLDWEGVRNEVSLRRAERG